MIELINVTKIFPGAPSPSVDNVSFRVNQGNICVLLGPSGCGKTTILRMMNRLEEPSSGKILINSENTLKSDPSALRRSIGYVIQQTGLLPHRTVARNIALVPGLLGWPQEKINNRVDELLKLMGLDSGDIADKYPHQLSGGQMQRVGVARAMAADPPIMLMDEPFGAVDPIIRIRLQDEFLKLQQQVRKTICFVTHDINEAIKMADYLIIFNQGRLVQMGSPVEVLTSPADDFVLSLIGDDRGVKILDLTRAETLMEPADNISDDLLGSGCTVQSYQPVKLALEVMMKKNQDRVGVCRGNHLAGTLSWSDIKRHINKVSGEESEL
ncbi:ABC transporter related protein [Desulfonatronospira thiodismutans ASO3-1]|uniref:ABC transporter related protein n=1 Tax=Desulfonatronospira thiodismutans ASO3-1 TaxID=555779 RepID=D6SL17_9BACT|nr:ATP-binding cassette domain-containing protein [Desulfonatronospira thiodismutans]EFI35378.1 ABC transporter related protein [Desulfonatronospira thiodismutans ASO3-1]